MPYTERQLRCLSGMGLVPWIERGLTVETDTPSFDTQPDQGSIAVLPSAELNADDDRIKSTASDTVVTESFESLPLLGMPFRGQTVFSLGNVDAPLLVLVEVCSTAQKQYPFDAADAKLFDDMLRGISWRRQDICLAVVCASGAQLNVTVDNNPCVSDVTKTHRDAVLVFRHSLADSHNPDDLRLVFQRQNTPVWQLPHPALLREVPARKRQAWNVLKAARACLS